jgi:hypothetical protein
VSETFRKVIELIDKGEIRISNHGYDELAEDGLRVKDVMIGIKDGKVVEDYPDYPVFSSFKEIGKVILFMLYGESRKGHLHQQF